MTLSGSIFMLSVDQPNSRSPSSLKMPNVSESCEKEQTCLKQDNIKDKQNAIFLKEIDSTDVRSSCSIFMLSVDQSVIISREGLILTQSILPCPQGSIF